MVFELQVAFATALLWVSFMIVMTLTAKVLDFGLPVLTDTMWKLAILAFCVTVADFILPFGCLLNYIVTTLIFLAGASKWFEMEFYQAALVTVLSRIVQIAIFVRLMSALAG